MHQNIASAFVQAEHTPERRALPRARLTGTATAVFSDGIDAGRLTSVDLVDASAGGLGVISPVPVRAGASFSLMPETGRFPRLVGLVVRCERGERGYRLGLSGRSRIAA